MGRDRGTGAARWLAAGAATLLARRALAALREQDLTGENALVTGGSRGLGLLLARELGRAGCRVSICARDPLQLENARRLLADEGLEVLTFVCDVAEPAEVSTMIERIRQQRGPLDILVNNAGIIQAAPVGAMDREDFEQALRVGFWGTANTVLEVLPEMRRRRSGRIVNITSIGGRVSIPHLLPYSTGKFAAYGFSQGLATELAREGIQVTTVVPGLMRTGSPVNAFFKGEPELEFAWFSLGAATPLTAMAAGRAARRIVAAIRRREVEVTLTWQARLLRLAHEAFPSGTTRVLAGVNRMLPRGERIRRNVRGMRLATAVSPSPLTVGMNRAARRTNQFGGRPEPSPRHAEKVGLARADDPHPDR